MKLENYYRLIEEAEDIEIDTSTPLKLQKTLKELEKKKRTLKKLKKMIMEDIMAIELDYLLKRVEVRKEIEDYEANPSLLKRLKGKDPHNLRLKVLKKIEKDREAKIKPYNELREYINKLIDDIEDIIIEHDKTKKRVKMEFNPPEFR